MKTTELTSPAYHNPDKKVARSTFGKHIMLDMRGCSFTCLDSLEHCFALLDELPEKLGMKKISAPHVFRYKADDPCESGITGVTFIAESHISLHTFPKKGYAFADIFSCKPFNDEPIGELIQKHFESSDFDLFDQERGRGFSQEPMI